MPENAVGGNSISIPVAGLPQNGVYMLRDRKIGIIRQEDKISAISLECTHLGCTLNVSGDVFVCPCHGSYFSLNGEVLKGPAKKNLRSVAVKVQDGNVVIEA